MNYPKERQEFTINEIARACGVSRKTLIRMEESGFLKPYRINPETGYRYYDAHNAAQVGQYQLLQMLGLTRGQITEVYHNNINRTEFLKMQRERLSLMQRTLEELELRDDPSRNFCSSFIELPGIACYCETAMITSAEDSEELFYKTQERCISAGYRLLGTEPLFGLSGDDYRMMTAAPQNITACIPVLPSGAREPGITVFPACRAFSMLAYGDYTVIGELCRRFWKAFDEKKLVSAGPARFVGITAPYVNATIPYSDFCYRLIVPLRDDNTAA